MNHSQDPSEHPPLFGTWSRFYAVVLGTLVFWILLFLWFSHVFA